MATTTQHTPRPLRSGELVGARYRLDVVAGRGGMATVWRAYDERLQRPVAIKVISDALATNPAAVARFAREARTHAGIQHPNLVQVYDYSVTADQPYLVMEYVNGSTLSQRLDRGGFPAAAIRMLAVELLSALACVHDHGVLHRDIKSGNVLIDNDGQARLTDFGLARLEDSPQITRANEVVGTLRYLAPELIEGRQASRQSDLYALGVLLRTVCRDTQPEQPLAKLIAKLTEHDPQARPRDAHEALSVVVAKQRQPRARTPTGGSPRKPSHDEPTEPLPRADGRQHTTSQQLRSRTAAVSALLVAAAGTALAIVDAGGNPAHAKPTTGAATMRAHAQTRASGVHARAHTNGTRAQTHVGTKTPTIDQQLLRLANGVRRAAKP